MKTNHNLSSPRSFTNPAVWQQKLNAAQTKNQAIAGTNLFESNEKELNTYYLNYLQNGMESLMPANLVWIESLAQKCTYLDGQAVFKARTLYAMLVGPKTYNDLEICNNLGVYKGGVNWYESENAQIGRSNKIRDIAIQVFPNPTNGEIYFTSNDVALSGAVVEFYDVLGRKVKSLALVKNLNKISYSLHELPMGIYQYQLKLSNGIQYTGKVVKE